MCKFIRHHQLKREYLNLLSIIVGHNLTSSVNIPFLGRSQRRSSYDSSSFKTSGMQMPENLRTHCDRLGLHPLSSLVENECIVDVLYKQFS